MTSEVDAAVCVSQAASCKPYAKTCSPVEAVGEKYGAHVARLEVSESRWL